MPTHKLCMSVREDGLRIFTKAIESQRIALAVVVNVGSCHDDPKTFGQFHFFEHMAFKGTVTKSEADIRRMVDEYCILGSNASTDLLDTTYYGIGLAKYTQIIGELLFDIVYKGIFPLEEIESEKEVVLNEIAVSEDRDGDVVEQALCEILYPQHHPMTFRGIGTRSGLKHIDQASLVQTRDTWYLPSNSAVFAAGHLSHSDILALVDLYIPYDFRKAPQRHFAQGGHKQILSPSILEYNRPKRAQATILYGSAIPPLNTFALKDRISLQILMDMLGGGESSLLWSELRAERGYVYGVSADIEGDRHFANYLTFKTATLPERKTEIQELIPQIILKPKLTAQHFDQTKKTMQDAFEVGSEGVDENFHDLIRKVIECGIADITEYRELNERRKKVLTEVTLEDVITIHQRYFNGDMLACAIVKPTGS